MWLSDIEAVPSSWVRFLPATLGGEIFAAREKMKITSVVVTSYHVLVPL